MRKDPPFDMEYVYTTYILERAEAAGVKVVNRPQVAAGCQREGLHRLVPPVLPAHAHRLRHGRASAAFLKEHKKIVVKPLEGMGGTMIFVLA